MNVIKKNKMTEKEKYTLELVKSIIPSVTNIVLKECYPATKDKDIADTIALISIHIAQNTIKEIEEFITIK